MNLRWMERRLLYSASRHNIGAREVLSTDLKHFGVAGLLWVPTISFSTPATPASVTRNSRNWETNMVPSNLPPFPSAATVQGKYHSLLKFYTMDNFRWFMQSQHINPEEAVLIHKYVKAENTMGIHWGTYEMGSNEVCTKTTYIYVY